MDLRVTSVLLVLLALAEATPHYQKVSKTPYPVKSHGESHRSFSHHGSSFEHNFTKTTIMTN